MSFESQSKLKFHKTAEVPNIKLQANVRCKLNAMIIQHKAHSALDKILLIFCIFLTRSLTSLGLIGCIMCLISFSDTAFNLAKMFLPFAVSERLKTLASFFDLVFFIIPLLTNFSMILLRYPSSMLIVFFISLAVQEPFLCISNIMRASDKENGLSKICLSRIPMILV